MTTSTIYAQADPTAESGYNVTTESVNSYSATFTVENSGTFKEIWYYSPDSPGEDGIEPTDVGLFAAGNSTALVHVTAPTWSGAEKTGWVKAVVPDTTVTPGQIYFAVIGNSNASTSFRQAYLYGGDTNWIPATSADSNISIPADTNGLSGGPAGPIGAYSNGLAFVYPDTLPPATLNWLIDVGIDFSVESANTIDVTNPGSQAGDISVPVSLQIDATDSDGTQTLTYSATGLPTGLSISSSTGLITGTPTTSGSYSVVVTVVDTTSVQQTASFSWSMVDLTEMTVSLTGTNGNVKTYSVTSGINNTDDSGSQDMRVLTPSSPVFGRPHAFLWMLPVEPGQGTQYGDSIETAQTLGIQNTYNLTCIQPGFPVDPWYGDNVDDPTTQQESFIMALVSWANENLATSGTEKHYLIGFSKSGFGGQVMFMKHQDVFAAVASWDSACDYQTLGQYDGGDVFGTQGNLDSYKLYDPNLDTWKAEGNTATVNRIWLGAGINLIQATSDYSDRLTVDGIQHSYSFVETDSHNWAPTPGWVAPAIAAMLGEPSRLAPLLFFIP